MSVLYTDNDPQICAWAEELVKAQLVPHGTVLCKSISDLQPEDLAGYTQVHLFAGILGWPYALRLAGWPDDIGVWSGSCPCQPFSCAGQRKGTADKRHLWPEMRRLIEQCQPPVVFGEQVASKDGRLWFSGVRADLEALGYAVGASDLCAAGVGAPNIRQRLFWVAFTRHERWSRLLHRPGSGAAENQGAPRSAGMGPGNPGGMANPRRFGGRPENPGREAWPNSRAQSGSETCGLAYNSSAGLEIGGEQSARGECQAAERSGEAGGMDDASGVRLQGGDGTGEPEQGAWRGRSLGFWSDYDLIPCADGKARRVRSGSFPLVNGAPARVVRLRGYGNAIVPELAAEFIKASIQAISEITVDCRSSG